MIRTAARSLAAFALLSCAAGGEALQDPAFQGPRNTDSPIAGETLRCPGDYPDSVLVFAPDGTLSGRYAGEEVSGEWARARAGRGAAPRRWHRRARHGAPHRVGLARGEHGLRLTDATRRCGSGGIARCRFRA